MGNYLNISIKILKTGDFLAADPSNLDLYNSNGYTKDCLAIKWPPYVTTTKNGFA